MAEPSPPWVAIPTMQPFIGANQGLEEWYVVRVFLPFWYELSAEQKTDYLDRWQTTPDWREAIAINYDHVGVDFEEEAREFDEMVERNQAGQAASRSPFRRWIDKLQGREG